MLSIPDLINRAMQRRSPPAEWLKFLSHPFLPSTWGALYEAVVEGGIVENRIKQLQRVLLAEYVQCPGWAPEASTSLTGAGIGSHERAALRSLDLTIFSRREQAAEHALVVALTAVGAAAMLSRELRSSATPSTSSGEDSAAASLASAIAPFNAGTKSW